MRWKITILQGLLQNFAKNDQKPKFKNQNNFVINKVVLKDSLLLAQRKMKGNKFKPKSLNLNPFLCQPDPIGS